MRQYSHLKIHLLIPTDVYEVDSKETVVVQAILFDLDGVLPELDLLLREAVQDALSQWKLPQAAVKEQVWPRGELQHYLEHLSQEQDVPRAELQANISQQFLLQIKAGNQIQRELYSLYLNAKLAGLPVVCVSKKTEDDVISLFQWFNREHGASQNSLQLLPWQEDVESYQTAVTNAGLVTEQSLFFSASEMAVRAASSTGSLVIALSDENGEKAFISAGAAATIRSLTEFGFFTTLAEFRRNGKRLVARQAAYLSRLNAYTPYSNFKVGAAIVSSNSGKIYAGCNVENSSYGATICAERGAIMQAIAAEGDLSIDLVVIVSDDTPPAVPCAMCLQVFAEFSHPKTDFSLYDLNGKVRHFSFEELLPHPFLLGEKRELLPE